MAKYQDNDWYLSIDGTDVSAYLKSVNLTASIEEQDITAGSGTNFRQRGAGLKDYQLTFDIYHDTAAAWALTLITPGIHAIIYGIEGSGSGNPKHIQSFLFTSAPHTVNVDKTMVSYNVSATGADAPSTDMFAGGVWA